MRILELENRCTGNRTVGSNPPSPPNSVDLQGFAAFFQPQPRSRPLPGLGEKSRDFRNQLWRKTAPGLGGSRAGPRGRAFGPGPSPFA
jgi:hypothetical protein